MNVAEVRESFEYNAWANNRIFDALAKLPAEQYTRDLKCSFGSIHGTVCHIVWAEQLWLNRWLAKPAPATPQGKDLAGLPEARARWDTIEAERDGALRDLTDQALTSPVTVKPTGGGAEFVHPLIQTLRHTVDHSSYHRGQIVTMLRQLGVTPPGVGMIGFYRERLAR